MERISECRDCGAPIFFAKSSNGKWVPLDVEPNEMGSVYLDTSGNCGPLEPSALILRSRKYFKHWARCPEKDHP